jgi:hypothetical protein
MPSMIGGDAFITGGVGGGGDFDRIIEHQEQGVFRWGGEARDQVASRHPFIRIQITGGRNLTSDPIQLNYRNARWMAGVGQGVAGDDSGRRSADHGDLPDRLPDAPQEFSMIHLPTAKGHRKAGRMDVPGSHGIAYGALARLKGLASIAGADSDPHVVHVSAKDRALRPRIGLALRIKSGGWGMSGASGR